MSRIDESRPFIAVRIAILTMSDTRTLAEDTSGATLVKLAEEYYGDGKLWKKIYDANRAVIGPNPDKIYPGQVLTIP